MKLASLLILLIIIFTGGSVTAADITKLDNGLTVVYRYIPNIKLVSVQTWVKTGSVNEDKRINGISHFLEHMVFKGTEKYAPGEIDLTVESSGGSMNAATSKDYTFYYVTAPVYSADKAFDVISEMVFKAQFIEEEIQKEKPVVIQEIKRKNDSPTAEMWETLSETVFTETPYSRSVIGFEENIEAFTRKDLVDYYDRFYHPENMTLVIAGDISHKEALKLAGQYFNVTRDVEAGELYDKEVIKVPQKNITRSFHKKVNQEYGVLAYPGEGMLHKDRYALEVLTEVLAGGEFSVIINRIKNQKKLALSVDAGYMGFKTNGAYLFTYLSAPNEGGKVIEEIEQIITELKDIVTEEMITKAKNRLKSQLVFQREKASSEARDIGFSYTIGIPEYYHDFTEEVSRVGKADVLAVADKFFSRKYIYLNTLPETKAN